MLKGEGRRDMVVERGVVIQWDLACGLHFRTSKLHAALDGFYQSDDANSKCGYNVNRGYLLS